MRFHAVVLAAALLAGWGPAVAAERIWSAYSDANVSTLTYGTPETDDFLISFRCRRATRELTVVFAIEPMGAKDGMRIHLDLFSVGVGSNIMLQATGHRLQLDDAFILETKTTLGPKLRKILAEGRALTIMVQDGTIEMPLKGAARGVAKLIEACGR